MPEPNESARPPNPSADRDRRSGGGRRAGNPTGKPRGKPSGQRSGAEPGSEGFREQVGVPTRRLALQILIETDSESQPFVDEALEERLEREDLPWRDRHLLQEVAYGCLRHRNTLDHLLNQYLRFPMKQQNLALRWGLRLGAYQVVYLDRIPVHAAVNGTLEALKSLGSVKEREIGFTNAVLRKLADSLRKKAKEPPQDWRDPTVIPIRDGFAHFDNVVLPVYGLEPERHLALKHSHPAWLAKRWIARFGDQEAAQLCAAGNRIPQVIARVTARSPGFEETRRAIEGASSGEDRPRAEPHGERFLVLSHCGDLRALKQIADGWIQIQDPTAAAIGDALEPPANARVLDLCSAPGGKAVQLLERLGPDGSLLACDVDPTRLERVTENLSRSGKTNWKTLLVSADADALDLGQKFTHILLDAPCSNTGVLARRPEARWRLRDDELPNLAARQKKLLEAAARHLEPKGRLVYATCSIEPEENGEVAAWAVETLGLRMVDEKLFLPHRDGGDGGYRAVLER